MARTVPLLLGVCCLAIVVVHSVDVNQYGLSSSREISPQYFQNRIEDEVDYLSSLSKNEDGMDYDWSPPDGELPETAADSLSLYFGNGNSQHVGDRIEQDRNIVDTEPNNALKRAIGLSKQKKTQVLCRVQKAIHHHSEAGYEFFPKSYTSYSCHPVGPSQYEGSLSTSHDVCLVKSDKCSTLLLKRFFLKRNQTNMCWSTIVSKEVGSGCDCLYHYKYRIHL